MSGVEAAVDLERINFRQNDSNPPTQSSNALRVDL